MRSRTVLTYPHTYPDASEAAVLQLEPRSAAHAVRHAQPRGTAEGAPLEAARDGGATNNVIHHYQLKDVIWLTLPPMLNDTRSPATERAPLEATFKEGA